MACRQICDKWGIAELHTAVVVALQICITCENAISHLQQQTPCQSPASELLYQPVFNSIQSLLKISLKTMLQFFFLVPNCVTISLPGKWTIFHDIGTVQRQRTTLLHTCYQVRFLFITWCKAKTVKLFHHTLVIRKEMSHQVFLTVSPLLIEHGHWTLKTPKPLSTPLLKLQFLTWEPLHRGKWTKIRYTRW